MRSPHYASEAVGTSEVVRKGVLSEEVDEMEVHEDRDRLRSPSYSLVIWMTRSDNYGVCGGMGHIWIFRTYVHHHFCEST